MNTVFKKSTSLLLVLVMLISIVLPNISLAIENQKITLSIVTSKTTFTRGETFKADIKINTTNNNGFNGFSMSLKYDPTVLEVVSGEATTVASAIGDLNTPLDQTIPEGQINYGLISMESLSLDQSIFTITFKVKENATSGESTIEFNDLDISFETGSTSNANTNKITYTVNVPAEKVELDKTNIDLWNTETTNLTATITPVDSTDTDITWSSDKPEIATVSNGKVTAVSKGTATITATTSNGKTATATVNVKQHITGISLNKGSLELERGNTENLVATILPNENDDDKAITWTSSNTAVATVSNGVVTAVGKGNATITATTSNGKSATCNVTVGVPLKEISFKDNKNSINLQIGIKEEDTLEVVFNPEDTDADKTVVWKSSNTAVATVTDGVVTAVGNGNATITATSSNQKVAECNVTVTIPLLSIDLKSETSIKYGEKEKLQVTYNPENTTDDKSTSWESDNEAVAIVSSDGTVEAKSVGTANITAKVIGTNLSKTCKVTVTEVPIEGISITEQNIILTRTSTNKETKQLHVTFNPEKTSDSQEIKWTSNNENVTVDATGLITAQKPGKATITATSSNGKIDTTEVTVEVPLEDIKLDKTKIILDRPQTEKLQVTLEPSDTTIANKVPTYTSSDTSIVTVDQNGVITPIKSGTAYIYAEVGSIKKSCEVTVNVPLENIDFEKTELTINKKTTTTPLKIVKTPTDTNWNGTVTFESSNTNVATVDNEGKVTGIAAGTATITAVTDTNKTATCEITVVEIPLEGISINPSNDFELGLGETQNLSIVCNPENTTDDIITTWQSSNPDVVSIDENGKITALSEGEVTITAIANGKESTIKVSAIFIPIESITVEAPIKNNQIEQGKDFYLSVTTTPSNATNRGKYKYSSSDKNILTVDENGKVSALKPGKAIVTVSSEDGVQSQYEVEVVAPVEPENTNKTTTSSPQTGDIAVEFFIGLMIISGLGIVVILAKNRKKK